MFLASGVSICVRWVGHIPQQVVHDKIRSVIEERMIAESEFTPFSQRSREVSYDVL